MVFGPTKAPSPNINSASIVAYSTCSMMTTALPLTKPFNSSELRARLRAGRRIIELQEQLMAAQEELRMRATHDSLTGLLNRSAITEKLRREMARCSREGQPVSIVMADLDKFKQLMIRSAIRRETRYCGKRPPACMLPFVAMTLSAATVARNSSWCCLLATKGEVWSLGERFRVLISASPFTLDRACWLSRAASAALRNLPAERGMPTRSSGLRTRPCMMPNTVAAIARYRLGIS